MDTRLFAPQSFWTERGYTAGATFPLRDGDFKVPADAIRCWRWEEWDADNDGHWDSDASSDKRFLVVCIMTATEILIATKFAAYTRWLYRDIWVLYNSYVLKL